MTYKIPELGPLFILWLMKTVVILMYLFIYLLKKEAKKSPLQYEIVWMNVWMLCYEWSKYEWNSKQIFDSKRKIHASNVEAGASRYIFQNELKKACFQHDRAYGCFKG